MSTHAFSAEFKARLDMVPHLFAAMMVREYAASKDITLDAAFDELHPVRGRGGVAMATARNVRAMKAALKAHYEAHKERAMEY